jgi:DNA-binding LacI/PurR family transcriptional regulator
VSKDRDTPIRSEEARPKGRRKRRLVTVATVATEAKVSRAAVSFAYNAPEQLSAETRVRILAAAKKLGYSPDPIARMLTTRKAGAVGLLMMNSIESAFADPFAAEFVRGMGRMCDRHNLALTLLPPQSGSISKTALNAIVDGVIALGVTPDHSGILALEQRNLPLVIVDGDPRPPWSCVQVEDEKGAYEAAAHVVSQGHRHIAIFSLEMRPVGLTAESHRSFYVPLQRMAGYQRAFAEASTPVKVETFEILSPEEADRIMRQILRRDDSRPTALLAMSDAIALSALKACHDLHVRVPQDISIIGFDDIPGAATASPALTTVMQPITEKAILAMQLLLREIEREPDEAFASQHVVLPTELKERHSTAPPKR